MPTKIKYKKPPIVERIVAVYHQIPQEEFDLRLPAWIEKIKKPYSRPEHIAEWQIEIEDKSGIPVIKTLQPKAKIFYQFWKPHPKGTKVYGLHLRPDRLAFRLRREEDDPHDFDELYVEMKEWIHQWSEHFGVPSVSGVALEYINMLSHEITPQFGTKDGGILTGEALMLFANIPGKYQSITAPYECRARLIIDEKMPCYFDVKVRLEAGEPTRVRVDLVATTRGNNRSITVAKALEEMDYAHTVMLEQFDCFFTPKAKESFLPNANNS